MATEGGDEGRLEIDDIVPSWDPDRVPGVMGVELMVAKVSNYSFGLWPIREIL